MPISKMNFDLKKVRELNDEDLRTLISEFSKIDAACAVVCNASTCKYLPLLQKIGGGPCERIGLYQLSAEGYDTLINQDFAKGVRDELVKKYGKWMSDFFAKDDFNKPVHEKRPISNIQTISLDAVMRG